MLSSDQNVETLSQLIEMVKHNMELRTEYVKLDVVDKVVRLLSAIALSSVLMLLVFAVMLFASGALACWLATFMEMSQALLIMAGFYLLIILLVVLMRKSWIERPLVGFVANLLLKKSS